MLTVISQNSLVPEVVVKPNNISLPSLLAHHNVTVFELMSEEDVKGGQLQLQRKPRSPTTRDDDFPDSDEEEAAAAAAGERHRQGQLGKLFPALAAAAAWKQAPAPFTWHERRANAKRNLMKLFDSFTNKKLLQQPNKTPLMMLKDGKLHGDVSRSNAVLSSTAPVALLLDADGSRIPEMTKEERIFLNSDNPRFPKDDVTLSMIDRRGGDVASSKDYDYVEFEDDKRFSGDFSEEDEDEDDEEEERMRFTSKKQQQQKRSKKEKKHHQQQRFNAVTAAKKPSSANSNEDLELWEIESHPKSSSRTSQRNIHHQSSSSSHRQGDNLRFSIAAAAADEDEEQEDEKMHPFSGFQKASVTAGAPHYYTVAAVDDKDEEGNDKRAYRTLNYTTDSYYSSGQQQQKRIRKANRTRRDIFGSPQPIEGAVHSLFHDISDNYPKMLERLAEAVRPETLPTLNILPDASHVANLLETVNGGGLDAVLSESIRKTRSSPFIHEDPLTNEVGFDFPTPSPVKPIEFKTTGDSKVASFVAIFLERIHAVQQQLRYWFS